MSEVLEFFLSNKNVIDALDADYYYLVFKMAKQLDFTEDQYRELVTILIDADIYDDKAEDDRIQLLCEIFENRIIYYSQLPDELNWLISNKLTKNDKLGFNDMAIEEILLDQFEQNRFKDFKLTEENNKIWIEYLK